MGLLNHLFGSAESIAQEVNVDESKVAKIWEKYIESYKAKGVVLSRLVAGNNNAPALNDLKGLLHSELSEIKTEEHDESEIVADLERLEHDRAIRRVHRLGDCLKYAETRFEYVHALLKEIHASLGAEAYLADEMLKTKTDPSRFMQGLHVQYAREGVAINNIDEIIHKFHGLFTGLLKGEHVIHRMDAHEKRLLRKLRGGFAKTAGLGPEGDGSTLSKWGEVMRFAIEDHILEGIEQGAYTQHEHLDLEFVNRPEFVTMAAGAMKYVRGRPASDRTIQALVHLYREWFNHQRD